MAEDLKDAAARLGIGRSWSPAWVGEVPTHLGPAVDVVVTLSDPWSVTDEHQIAAWYEGGDLLLSGPHTVMEGKTDVLKKIPVVPGGVLVIAMNRPWVYRSAADVLAGDAGAVPVEVQFTGAGGGDLLAAAVAKEKKAEGNPLADSIGKVATAVVVVALVWLFIESGAGEVSRAGASLTARELLRKGG